MDTRSKGVGRLEAIGSLLLTAYQEWVRDRCAGLAAAMAFGGVLVSASFVAAVLVLAARLLGEAWTRAYVLPAAMAWLGPQGVAVARAMLAQANVIEVRSLLTLSVVGTIGLIYGAEGLFLTLQDSVQTIWNVRREEANVLVQMQKRLLGLLYAGGSAAIVLAGLVAAGVLFTYDRAEPADGSHDVVRLIGSTLIAFLTFWALSTFWFKVLPPIRLTRGQILPWTALAAALHLLGRAVLMWVVASGGPASQVDIGEAIILTMLWFQYASMVFLYAAQLMRVYLIRYGGVAEPREPEASG